MRDPLKDPIRGDLFTNEPSECPQIIRVIDNYNGVSFKLANAPAWKWSILKFQNLPDWHDTMGDGKWTVVYSRE